MESGKWCENASLLSWMQLYWRLEGKESAVMYCGGERGDVLQENTTSPFHDT